MDIYFVDISKLFIDNKPKFNKIQHKIGRKMLDYLLKNKYNLEPNILEQDGKPYLENNPIYFNISHSNKLVGIAFDKNKIGLDIEIIKPRNYKSILKHFNINEDISEKEFFQMWTVYEAEYKSGIKDKLLSFEYENYVVSVSYESECSLNFYKINEGNNDITKIDIPKFLTNLTKKITV